MAYTKTNWVDDVTETNADNFNHIEQGIYDAHESLASKQDTLVSGTNIKTINSNSIVGSGDLEVQDKLVSGTNIKTINGVSLLSSGDMEVGASIPIQDTAPSNPLEDDLWIDTSASGGGTNILDAIYPIGSVVIRDSSVDLSNWLGFTWQKTFAGRVLVGLDTSQTEFNTIGKTGGSKATQQHSHPMVSSYGVTGWGLAQNSGGYSDYIMLAGANTGNNKNQSTGNSGSGDSGNLQPYQVVAYWKRTA